MHNLSDNYKAVSLIKPKSITTTETGTGVAIASYENDAMAVIDYGALGGTSETFIATVETSTDGGSTYTTALTFSTGTGSGSDNKLAAGRVDLSGCTHVRGVITMSGSSASLVAMYILVKPSTGGPTTNSVTLA